MYSYFEKEVMIDITERLLTALKLIDETQRLRSIGVNGGRININTNLTITTKDYAINVLKKELIGYGVKLNHRGYMVIPTLQFKSVVLNGNDEVSLNFLCYYGDQSAINMELSNDRDKALSLFENASKELLLNIGNLKDSLSIAKKDDAILSALEALKQMPNYIHYKDLTELLEKNGKHVLVDNKVFNFISIEITEPSDIGIDRPRNMILALGSDENKDCIFISKDAIKNLNRQLQLLRIGENNGIRE